MWDGGNSCVIDVGPSPLICEDGAVDEADFCLAPDVRSWEAELPVRAIREGGGDGDDGCCSGRWERVDGACDTGELGVGSDAIEFDIVLELGLDTGLVSPTVLFVADIDAAVGAALGPALTLACFAASFSSSSSSSSSRPLMASNLASVKSITLPMVMPPPSTAEDGPASDSSGNPSVEDAETPC